MNDVISIRGPVESVDGELALLIPLAYGGDKLAHLAKGIGEVDGDHLKVIIQPWLAQKLGITAGSTVVVHNGEGRFNIVVDDGQ